jgi:hypothetical protein
MTLALAAATFTVDASDVIALCLGVLLGLFIARR